MALRSVRSDQFAPCITKTFVVADFASARVLHEDALYGGDAPSGINHLPASIWVEAEALDVLSWKDAKGNTVAKTFTAAFIGTLPFTIAELTTSTTVVSVTVAWHPSGA